MEEQSQEFISRIPQLDLSEGPEMLTDFSREAQRHLIAARNALLILETVPSDKEAIEDVFKTFHTIKGLADFLQLHDICCLTFEAEMLLDKSRKDLLPFDLEIIQLVARTIESLQLLLELLDEQIVNKGKLVSDYLDVKEIISEIHRMTAKCSPEARPRRPIVKVIPTINYEPDMTACTQLEAELQDKQGIVPMSTEMLTKIVRDFQDTSRELKVAQSKLQERQRELIKERELAIKLTQQAQEEARAKSEYLANMSHEIRTLINAILGFTDLLKESGLNAKQKEHLNTIILSGRMLLEIVNDILDFSKVEAGKLKLEKIEFDLEYIVEEVFKIIRTRLVGKPINLYFNIAEDVPKSILGDPTRLKQIFINLIDNAIKFTEQGEIGLQISVAEFSVTPDRTKLLRFVVKDSGVGIPVDRQKAVFDSFTQAHDSTTRIYGGSGLGLALCKTFVETMGGKIWLESELGKGSSFIFTVAFAESPTATTHGDPFGKCRFPGTRILIVDANEASSRMMEKFCRLAGIEVMANLTSAKQASEYLLRLATDKKELPRAVFVDLLLPEKEGYMLTYKLRQMENFKSLKLVGMASDMRLETANDFANAGFDVFLAKPFLSGEIVAVFQGLFGEKVLETRIISEDMIQKISCAGVKVLVAEDSLPNLELLKIHFETLGCACDYANNGEEAIEFLKKNDYDICFMDLQMPVMGGLKATEVIRNDLKKSLPIVALTAAELEDEREKCFEVGMNDYLPKPFGIDELKGKIIRHARM